MVQSDGRRHNIKQTQPNLTFTVHEFMAAGCFFFFAGGSDEFVFNTEEKRCVRRDHLGSVQRRE